MKKTEKQFDFNPGDLFVSLEGKRIYYIYSIRKYDNLCSLNVYNRHNKMWTRISYNDDHLRKHIDADGTCYCMIYYSVKTNDN